MPPFTLFMKHAIEDIALLIGVMGSLSCNFFAEDAAASSFRSSQSMPSCIPARAIDCTAGTLNSPHAHRSNSKAAKADDLLPDTTP